MTAADDQLGATLESLCEINPGRPDFAKYRDNTRVLFVPMEAVDEVSGEVVAAQTRRLRDLRDKSYRTFTSGDVLFAKITPSMENGKAAIVPAIPSGLGFGSTEFHVLRPRPGISPRLIWHFVRQRSLRRAAEQHLSGSVGQLRVPPSFLRDYPIEVPLDGRQNEVVRLMDAVTRAAGRGREHFASARKTLDRFRHSVLGAACAGRLTVEWRESHLDVEPAAMLVRRIQRPRPPVVDASVAADLPDTWCRTPIGALVEVATGATPLRSRPEYYGGDVPWVTSGAVNAGVIQRPSAMITKLALAETNAKVFPVGTVLVAMYGEGQTRGRVAELGMDAATNQAVAALVFDKDTEFLRPYLRLFLLENYERIRRLAFGGVQPNLSLTIIRETLVPLPPAPEQVEIVRRVDQLMTVARALQKSLEAASVKLDQAEQAVGTKAFRGELPLDGDGELVTSKHPPSATGSRRLADK